MAVRKETKQESVSYIEILKMDPLVFLTFLEQYKIDVSCNVDSAEDMSRAGEMLGKLSNIYSFLVSLYTYAGVLKRQLSRTDKVLEYQDMIDREAILEAYLKSVDMSYRSVSKAINVHIENNRELSMTDGIVDRRRNKA